LAWEVGFIWLGDRVSASRKVAGFGGTDLKTRRTPCGENAYAAART
jgi:hypothetical protein